MYDKSDTTIGKLLARLNQICCVYVWVIHVDLFFQNNFPNNAWTKYTRQNWICLVNSLFSGGRPNSCYIGNKPLYFHEMLLTKVFGVQYCVHGSPFCLFSYQNYSSHRHAPVSLCRWAKTSQYPPTTCSISHHMMHWIAMYLTSLVSSLSFNKTA